MRIAVDIDGVLADFDRGWTTAHQATCGCGVAPGLPQTYGDATLASMAHLPSGVAFWAWFRRCVGYSSLPPVEGAIDGLVRLAQAHEVLLATSRPYEDAPATRTWVERSWGRPWPVVHTRNKEWLDCDLWVDDNPDQIHRIRDTRGPDSAICFTQPWNDAVAPPRANSWESLLPLLGRLAW